MAVMPIDAEPEWLDDRQQAFSELLARHEGRIFGYIVALVHNLSDAEDLFQEVALVLWNKFDEFDRTDENGSFAHWACQTAQYLVLNFLRRKKLRTGVAFGEEFVAQISERYPSLVSDRAAEAADERLEALRQCMSKLKAEDRELVQLCYSQGKTIKQVAEELGRTAKAVYHALDRIRGQLFECIRRSVEQEDAAQ